MKPLRGSEAKTQVLHRSLLGGKALQIIETLLSARQDVHGHKSIFNLPHTYSIKQIRELSKGQEISMW